MHFFSMHSHTPDHKVCRCSVRTSRRTCTSVRMLNTPLLCISLLLTNTHTQISTMSQAPCTISNTVHNGKQTVISRFQAASQLRSTLLLVCPRLWGGAAAVGFNKSIVFGSCLKGLGFILEHCCFCCCGCGRREGYCAGTWGRLGSVSL